MKKVKLILPALAFLFAIASALATEISYKPASLVATELDATFGIDDCLKDGVCDSGGMTPCSSGTTLFEPSAGATCPTEVIGTNYH